MWNSKNTNQVWLFCALAWTFALELAHHAEADTPPDGTVVYCRHNPTNDLTTVWFANLQGGTDTLVTSGWMAHVSLDRRHLVFLRSGPNGSGYGSRGDVWVRDLVTGAETNLYHNSDFIVSADFTRDASQIIFDFECSDWSIPSDGSANGGKTFLFGGNCYDDAPTVNPIDGRVAFHNNAGGGGIGIATTNFQNKSLIPNTAQGTYALWSRDGQWVSYTLTSAYYTYSGYNLYKIHPDGSARTQLTFLTGATNFFSFGAAWVPGDTALIGAATINGTNGLYQVAADGSGTISLLNIIQPGDPVAYVGAVLGNPGLQLEVLLSATNTVLLYWPSPSTGFNLQQNPNLATANWTTPSETVNDNGTIRYVVVSAPTSGRFFRLAKP